MSSSMAAETPKWSTKCQCLKCCEMSHGVHQYKPSKCFVMSSYKVMIHHCVKWLHYRISSAMFLKCHVSRAHRHQKKMFLEETSSSKIFHLRVLSHDTRNAARHHFLLMYILKKAETRRHVHRLEGKCSASSGWRENTVQENVNQ